VLVAVRVEDDRTLPELLLQAVGIQLGLLLAYRGIAARALGLDDAQRPAVIAPQHVIDEARASPVGHAGHRELAIAWLVERPARLVQQDVYERVAGGVFGVVVSIGNRRRRLLRRFHLGADPGDLGVQGVLVGARGGQLLVSLAERRLQLLQLVQRLTRDRRCRKAGRIERQPWLGARLAGVPPREPVREMEQLADDGGRFGNADRLRAVDRLVARLDDQLRLQEDRLAHGGLEGGLVQPRHQVVLIGRLQRGVVLERPRRRELDGAAGVKTRCPRIAMHGRRGLVRRLVDVVRPVRPQEPE